MSKNVIVTDCHSRSGFALARDLSNAGHRVVALGLRAPTTCKRLPGLLGEAAYDEPFCDREAFVGVINEAARKYDAEFLLPCKEETFVVSYHKDDFDQSLKVLVPPFEALMGFHDKVCLDRHFAPGVVVPPPTRRVRSPEDYRACVEDMGLPLMLKPEFGTAGGGLHRIRGPQEERDFLGELERGDGDTSFVGQPLIAGNEVGYGVLLHEGRIVALCGQRSFSEISGDRGVSAGRTTFVDDRLEAALVEGFAMEGFSGPLEMDVLIDGDRYWVIDINPRYWGGTPTAIDSGVPMATMQIDLASGGTAPAEAVRPQRLVESHWFLGNLRFFFESIGRLRIGRAISAFHRETDLPLVYDDFGPGRRSALVPELLGYLRAKRQCGNFDSLSPEREAFFREHAVAR